MKKAQTSAARKPNKDLRELRVLAALIEQFLLTGKPVGSQALHSALNLSSATVRNYFATLEEKGFLSQQHTSGGRLPTERAYRLYAQELHALPPTAEQIKSASAACQLQGREIALYLQQTAEVFSQLTNSAVFLSAPRFDHDFIIAIRLIAIDHNRCLAVLITDFGVVKPELLHVEHQLSAHALKRVEEYCQGRLHGISSKPEGMSDSELTLAQSIYHELMLRYVVNYSNFSSDDFYRTGFSKLLAHPEFQDPVALTASLALFENNHTLKMLCKACTAHDDLRFWLGSDLNSFSAAAPDCTVAAIPYRINGHPVGVLGLLLPMRMPYREIFGIMRAFGTAISEILTQSIYKFKIKYRTAEENPLLLNSEQQQLIGHSNLFLLENRTSNH